MGEGSVAYPVGRGVAVRRLWVRVVGGKGKRAGWWRLSRPSLLGRAEWEWRVRFLWALGAGD